jgi:hypothetical protein
MIRQSPIKKTTQLSLNSVPLREIVITLDEQNEESLIGGANEPPTQKTQNGGRSFSPFPDLLVI